MKYLPVFIDIDKKTCLIIGGGDVALRKLRLLVKCQAHIKLIARQIDSDTKVFLKAHDCLYLEKDFDKNDLDHCLLVVAATNSPELNRSIYQEALARNILVNVVDQPDLCTFIFPSVIDRHPVIVAVSSGGSSPILARLLRARLETLIPANYGALAELAGKFRGRVKQAITNAQQRRFFWEKMLQGPVAELVYANRLKEAENLLEGEINSPLSKSSGEVYLVGAGPGDPDLLTFRALRLMQQADVVFYDRLVSPPILELVRKDAERIYVGKQRSDHSLPQPGINQALIDYARRGLRVLRLKGGDPFIFGRGGEEIEQLAEHGIPFQVVPGITAASGCAAYAGIPLTHRDHAQSVRFLTGHLKEGAVDLHWPELIDKHQTLVFYMGLMSLNQICHKLVSHGRDPVTPVALIEKGTLPEQRVYISTLRDLGACLAKHSVKAPTILIVGSVVSLAEKLSWCKPSSE